MLAMSVSDTTLVCRQCGSDFLFTAGERAFYAERGFVPPSRCPDCRAVRRREREELAQQASLTRSPSSLYREPRPMFPAICSDCGRSTMVPFEPRPGRSVFCRECFQNHKDEYRT